MKESQSSASKAGQLLETPRGPISFRLALRVDSICDKIASAKPSELTVSAIPRPHVKPTGEMSQSDAPRERDSLAIVREVDQRCGDFEDAWREGLRPLIEDFLPAAAHAARGLVLRELIALEIELRQRDGDSPRADDYADRFGTEVESLAGLFDELPVPSEDEAGHSPAPASSADSTPSRVGPYELLGKIGRGGMGVVYQARHVELGRVVALKMILSGVFASESEIVRFRGEAEAAANLEHPNIVPIHEVSRHAGQPYYTMRLLTGGSLARKLKKGPIEPSRAARIVATVARAMHHAHRRGLVHRDLKPGNILFDEAGQPHVTDFGLAKRLGRNGPTGSGCPLGTPGYMAPEQAAGRTDINASADIYSLGAILYELLTGRRAFSASTVMETLVQIMEREPEAPRKLNPAAPRALEQICLKCLEKDPTWRYASAAALADDLDRFLCGEQTDATPRNFFSTIRRAARRETSLTCRLLGLGLISICTQSNFLRIPSLSWAMHLRVTGVELLWIAITVALHLNSRNPKHVERTRAIWVMADLICITAVFYLRNATTSSLILGYGLLIAISGLWARSKLVWMTTFTAMICYSVLAVDAWSQGAGTDPNHHPNMVLAILAVLGVVVVQQVKRIQALSSFFENREPEPASAV